MVYLRVHILLAKVESFQSNKVSNIAEVSQKRTMPNANLKKVGERITFDSLFNDCLQAAIRHIAENFQIQMPYLIHLC